MKRTIDIMTTARAKGAELPAEWWGWVCPVCGYQAGRGITHCRNGNWANGFQPVDSVTAEYRYIGPDLELPENIHHAFTVADALCAPGFRTEVWWVEERKLFSGTLDDGFNEIFAPERHLALVAACEAALGIERGEAGA